MSSASSDVYLVVNLLGMDLSQRPRHRASKEA